MKTIRVRGLTVDQAALALCVNAPARGDYFGVVMRARYATTLPQDVAEQYRRIIAAKVARYGSNLTRSMRDRLRCKCGATGCKMWREYQTFSDYTEILCGPCAMAVQKKTGTIDADGKRESDFGKSDQIGWLVPAVPVVGEDTFWGYTSVPDEGVAWWRALPSYPSGGAA